MKYSLALIYMILIASNPSLATKITGKLKDKDNNPLSYAMVKVVNTQTSAISNEHGFYELNIDTGTYQLTCEAVGFASITKEVTVRTEDLSIDFQLTTQQYNLDQVVVTANDEDPGVRIMRKVIKAKSQHRNFVQSFQSDIYMKAVLKMLNMPDQFMGQKISDTDKVEMGVNKNGEGIIFLMEQTMRHYEQQPNKKFTKILSVKTSGDPQGLGIPTMLPITNIYKNNVRILGGIGERGFISPAHSNAIHYYKFKLEGTYFEHEKMIYKIKVTPKRAYEPCFKGYVYVVDEDWAFKAVDLKLDKSSGITKMSELLFKQTYRPELKHNWIIENQTIIPLIDIFGFKVNGSIISAYSHQKVNQKIPSDIFKDKKLITTYDTAALKRDSTYWEANRNAALTKEEIKSYKHIDSMGVVYTQRADSMKKRFRSNTSLTSLLLSGPSFTYKNCSLSTNSLLDITQFNSVEGLNLTLKPKLTWRIDKNNTFSGKYFARYGFSSQQYYQKIHFKFEHKKKNQPQKKLTGQLIFGHYIQEFSHQMPITELYNSSMTLFGDNYLKFYEKKFANLNWSYALGNGIRFSLDAQYENRKRLMNNSNYTWRNRYSHKLTSNQPPFVPPMPNHQSFTIKATATFQPGWKYIQYPDFKTGIPSRHPIFSATYQKGVKGVLGSDTDFDHWKLSIQHSQFLKLLGTLKYSITTGGFLNMRQIYAPDYKYFKGNQIQISTFQPNTFQLARYYEFNTTAPFYSEGHAEWHLNGFLTNKIPPFKQLKWDLVVGAKALFISPKKYYTEYSLGFENIGFSLFRLMRIDGVIGHSSNSNQPRFGIRFGLNGILNGNIMIK